jgi:outer membrane protein assembly factor BamB
VLAGSILALSIPTPGLTQEGWPQWGGSNRDFHVGDPGLASEWPASGPPVIWQRPLGLGHSGIVVVGDRVYTMYRPIAPELPEGEFAAEEVIVALSASDGSLVWEYRYPSLPQNFGFGAGPHSTPLFVDGRLFAVSSDKKLFALDATSGELLWSHDLIGEYDAPANLIEPAVKAGYAPSPLAWQGTVIVPVGGDGQAVMAFDQQTGDPAWKSGSFRLAHASPRVIDVSSEIFTAEGVEIETEPHLVVTGGQTINGLDPETGALLWSHEHPTAGDMNNSTPLWYPEKNLLVVSSAYEGGTRALEIGLGVRDTVFVEQRWAHRRMQVMFGNLVRFGNVLAGSSGDFGPAFLMAVRVEDGDILWLERGFGRASLVRVGEKLLILDEDGTLALAEPTVERLGVVARAELGSGVTWTVPTVVGSTVYLRDRETIRALELPTLP